MKPVKDGATARPWKLKFNGSELIGIFDSNGNGSSDIPIAIRTANPKLIANASLIVKAVNRDHLFEELVEALKEARVLSATISQATQLNQAGSDINTITGEKVTWTSTQGWAKKVTDKIDQATSKVSEVSND